MHRWLFIAVAMATTAVNAQAPSETVAYAVAYIDVQPSGRTAAIAALKAYRTASAKEAGHLRIDLFEQIGRPGHFAVVETWRDQASFESHTSGATAKQFQQSLTPVRVSGYDERPYKVLSVAATRSGAAMVHIVSHVDIGGAAGQAVAPAMLRQLADTSRTEAGNVRFDVLQHVMRLNHYTIVESWANQAALDAHAAAAHTRDYRDKVQPISGSPIDERVYLTIE